MWSPFAFGRSQAVRGKRQPGRYAARRAVRPGALPSSQPASQPGTWGSVARLPPAVAATLANRLPRLPQAGQTRPGPAR